MKKPHRLIAIVLILGVGVLDYNLGLAVDGQDKRVYGLPEALEQVDGIAPELTERSDVVGKVEHHILVELH